MVKGVLEALDDSRHNWRTPARLAFIDRLKRDGWHHAARNFTLDNYCEVFLHRDFDHAVKVSCYYVPSREGWRDFAQWTIDQRIEGFDSPYLPRIWDLEIHDRWFTARMERLEEIDDYRPLVMGQIEEIRRILSNSPVRDYAALSEDQRSQLIAAYDFGADDELADVLRRFVTRFKYAFTNYRGRNMIHPAPSNRNFMIRPGVKPQLVINDPVAEDHTPEMKRMLNEAYDARQQAARQQALERQELVLNVARSVGSLVGTLSYFRAKLPGRADRN